jgi:putative ABC transport system ATP-binding protein
MTSSSTPALEFLGVHKRFTEGSRPRVVLDGVDLAIGAGELVVLLGRSGSGKSTLLHLGAGLDVPDSGDVRFEGRSLPAMSETERTRLRRDRVGFVFQAFNLIPTLTVEENLFLPLELGGRATPATRRRALEILAHVGLADRAATFPDRLSGGEQQRVAVARALAHDPAVVFADEPTGNLDLDTGLEVLELLDRLTRREGKTLVMVTHGSEVVGLADRVFRLDHGRVLPVGEG